jgi:NTP pyrophosphatase (non-canonical NTP hydrolase)
VITQISNGDTIFEIQEKVGEFCQQRQLGSDINARLLDLLSELGELAKESLRQTSYGTKSFTSSTEWENEMGDIVFSLVCLANQSETDLASVLSSALDKYQSRLNRTGSIASDSS